MLSLFSLAPNYVGNSICSVSKAITSKKFNWVTVTAVNFDWLQAKSLHGTELLAVYPEWQ